jgi:hypothetical protein
MSVRILLFAAIAMLHASMAGAWTRPGHMVTAAIAWHEITEQHPELLLPIGKMLLAHPDRGPFQVAIDRATGQEQARRLFLECARWPDDIRGSLFDHPTWHYALSAIGAKPTGKTADGLQGDAIEAFTLAFHTLSNTKAELPDRAQALCWMLHIAGDIHQPLHTAQSFSADYPDGDGAGGKRFVKDPLTGEAISLHWLWDDSVNRSGAVADVDARAKAILDKLPRSSLIELKNPAKPSDFATWAREESLPLAKFLVFRADLVTAQTAEKAAPVADKYWTDVQRAAERRVAIAGYRIGDLVMIALAGG